MKQGRASICFLVLGLMVLLSVPAGAAGYTRVAAGFDNWQTLGSGATRYSFGAQPIPADFFCVGSQAFRGTVEFEGVPLRTLPDGILGTTDTVVERLDVAVFDKNGVATTRLRARALNLVGTKLVENRCGAWKVTATLAGQQPVTRLTFRRENAYGGLFSADLKLRVQVTFTEVKTGATRTLVRRIDMPTVDGTPFALKGDVDEPCADAEDSEAGRGGVLVGDIVLLDGHMDDRADSRNPRLATKLTPRPEVLRFKDGDGDGESDDPGDDEETGEAATGCRCNGEGHCLPVYSWHQPDCIGGRYDCELHFTTPPCQVYGFAQCTGATTTTGSDQLRILRERGFIHENPATVLQKQVRSAEQVRADQARRLAEQIRAAEKH